MGGGFYPVYWDIYFMGISEAADHVNLPERFDKNEVAEVWQKFAKFIVSVMQDSYLDGLKEIECAEQQGANNN